MTRALTRQSCLGQGRGVKAWWALARPQARAGEPSFPGIRAKQAPAESPGLFFDRAIAAPERNLGDLQRHVAPRAHLGEQGGVPPQPITTEASG